MLRKTAVEIDMDSPELDTFVADLFETMYHAEGVGLAAPQVGILRRVCVVDVTEDHTGLRELVNPVVLETEGTQTGREGCLSVPGRQGVVTRPRKVRIAYQDRHGKPMELKAEGFEARAVCHEIDHLDGIVFTRKCERMLTDEELQAMQEKESSKA